MHLRAFVKVALFAVAMVATKIKDGDCAEEFPLIQGNENFNTSQDNDTLGSVKTPYEFNEFLLENESTTAETASIMDITVSEDLHDFDMNATGESNAAESWTETSETLIFENKSDTGNVAEALTEPSATDFSNETSTKETLTETSTAEETLTETSTKETLTETSTKETLTETSTAEETLPETSTKETLTETYTEEILTETSETVLVEDENLDQGNQTVTSTETIDTATDAKDHEEDGKRPGSFNWNDQGFGVNTIPGQGDNAGTDNRRTFELGIRFTIPRVLLPYTPPPADFFRRLFRPFTNYGVSNWDDSQHTWRGLRIPWPFTPAARWQGHQIPN